jgi:hypothetical protein
MGGDEIRTPAGMRSKMGNKSLIDENDRSGALSSNRKREPSLTMQSLL